MNPASPEIFKPGPSATVSLKDIESQKALALMALTRTRMPIVVTDARRDGHPIVLANPAFLELTGYRADEILGRDCRFLQGPGTSQAAIDQIRAALSEARETTVEILNYRKDGSSFWNRLLISPVHGEDGQLLYMFGSQRDVTEAHRLEELERAERRLLKEVDHRAMNVLALVQGIVRLTKVTTPAQYAAAVQGRVQVLARAHALLALRGWSQASLTELIEGAFESCGLDRVRLDGPPVAIFAAQVQPLMIVLHEMISNALAHGALTATDGVVSLSWTLDNATVNLEWRERGGPSPTAPGPAGFGFTMTDAILRRQMKGSIDRTWDASGLVANLTVPTERVSDRAA